MDFMWQKFKMEWIPLIIAVDFYVVFVLQVQKFLEKNQREVQMTEYGEEGVRCNPESGDRPPFPGEMLEEEVKRRSEECKIVVEDNTEAKGEENSEKERTSCPSLSTSFNSATWTVDIKDEEQPGRHITNLEIPDFLRPVTPEGNNG